MNVRPNQYMMQMIVTPDLISGEPNNLKVTFRNTGKTDLKVNLIVGSVAEISDFNNVIRNVGFQHCSSWMVYLLQG